jgi:AraC-like DNA-binding protein
MAATAMSPLQYQKRLRLQEARRLILSEAFDAASAGFRVSYESPSRPFSSLTRPPDFGRILLRPRLPLVASLPCSERTHAAGMTTATRFSGRPMGLTLP